MKKDGFREGDHPRGKNGRFVDKPTLYESASGGSVRKSYSGTPKEESQNLAAEKPLAEQGKKITLISPVNKEGVRTADAIIDGEYWEIKTNKTPTKSAIDHEIRKANTQAGKMIIHVTSGISEETLMRGIKGRLPHTKIDELVIVKDGTVRHYSKDDFV